MKTIVVATDFSAPAQNAAVYAAHLARAVKAELFLLHVFQYPVGYGDIAVPMNIGEWQQDAEKSLVKLAKELEQQTNGDVKVRTEVAMGSYLPELEALCERIDPYAVVIGSTGKSAVEKVFFGSQAVQAMKSLAWPVITVPQGVQFASLAKIGLACDFDNVVDNVPVGEISQLVNDFKAELHILNIGREKVFDPEVVFGSGILKQLLAKAKPQFHFIDSNADADQAILDFAEKHNIDLLVVLPKRHSLPDAIMHRSHTKQFVLHSHVPLMALHSSTHTR